ncbi:hypothetical protein ACJX0J_042174, partial [Zea mays]
IMLKLLGQEADSFGKRAEMYYHTRPENEICIIQDRFDAPMRVDRFDAHAAIGDDEARALMIVTALRSCQGTISELVRHSKELIKLAAVEFEKTKSLRAQRPLNLLPLNFTTDPQCSSGATMIEAPTLRHSLGQDREDISEVVSDNGNDGIQNRRKRSM